MSDKSEKNLGGAYALAGFLYQAIGVGAIAAQIHAVQPLDDGPELRLSIEGNFKLMHERFGQDAVLERRGISQPKGAQRRTFVQFKHSSDPDRNVCQPRDLLGIVDGFLKSRVAADKQSKLEADFMLVTNRSLSPEAATMIDNIVNGKADDRLGEPTQNKSERDVLQKLQVVRIASESLRKQIDNYAAERGVLETELEDRLGNLIAAVQGLTGGDGDLNEAWLSKRLTGVDDIRPITPDALQPDMEQALTEFAGNSGVPHWVVRREVTDDIELAMLEKPVVVLVGSGGRGKTVIQHQVLSSLLNAGNRYVAASVARGINRDNWLAHYVQQWRGGNPELPNDPPERAVRRLERARGDGAYPLLLIDIDGLDESAALYPLDRAYVSQVLDLACNEDSKNGPKLTVVVSCRRETELKRTWPNFRHHESTNKIERIPIVDFTDAELRRVVNRSELKDELLPRLPGELEDAPLSPARELPNGARRGRPLPQPIVTAIRHPMLWGCLIDLERRSDVLSGSKEALRQWAAAYVERFLEKVELRRPEFDGLDIERLLRRIAVAVEPQVRAASRTTDWIAAAKNGQFDPTEAKTVYREAVSFGIIEEEEQGGWRWTHPFVQEYLANGESN